MNFDWKSAVSTVFHTDSGLKYEILKIFIDLNFSP